MTPNTVSVVIPAFNAATSLTATIDSALAQRSDAAVDILVVDDGSTDDTPKILSGLSSVVRTVRTANRGVSAARQLGLERTAGRWVLFLDSDDLLTRGTVRSRLDALEDSGADAAYTGWQRLERTEGGEHRASTIVLRRIEDVHVDPQVALFTEFWAPPGAWLFSRLLLERMPPWSPTLPVIQDARYALDAAIAGARFVHVAEVGVLYRSSSAGSLSRRDSHAFVKDCLTNAIEVEQLWESDGLTPERRRALAAVYSYVSCDLLRLGENVWAEHAYRRLRRNEPRFGLSRAQISGAVNVIVGPRSARAGLRLMDKVARSSRLLNHSGKARKS